VLANTVEIFVCRKNITDQMGLFLVHDEARRDLVAGTAQSQLSVKKNPIAAQDCSV
jgi:hypothetical protein